MRRAGSVEGLALSAEMTVQPGITIVSKSTHE